MFKSPAHEALHATMAQNQLQSVQLLQHGFDSLEKASLYEIGVSQVETGNDKHLGWLIGSARSGEGFKSVAVTADHHLWIGDLVVDHSAQSQRWVRAEAEPLYLPYLESKMESGDVVLGEDVPFGPENHLFAELGKVLKWPGNIETQIGRLMVRLMPQPGMYDKPRA